jgi:hypothetical protein
MAVAIRAKPGAAAVDRLTVLDDRLTIRCSITSSPTVLPASARLPPKRSTTAWRRRLGPVPTPPRCCSSGGDLARGSTSITSRIANCNRRAPRQADLTQGLLISLADRLLGSMPSERECGRPGPCAHGRRHAELLRTAQTAGTANPLSLPVRQVDVMAAPAGHRPGEGSAAHDGRQRCTGRSRYPRVERAGHHLEVPVDELQRDAAALRALVAPSLQLEHATLVGALHAIGTKAVLGDGFAEPRAIAFRRRRLDWSPSSTRPSPCRRASYA